MIWRRTFANDLAAYAFSLYTGVVYLTENQAKNKVINLAKAEVGYKEKRSGANLNSKTANAGSNNYTKYNQVMHSIQPSNMDYPAPWCDAFVDWLFYTCFGKALAKKMLCGDFDDYTVTSAQLYKNAGRWTVNPAAGYQIFFRNGAGICHTGLVVKVSGGKVYTVEGNSSDAVREKTYRVGDPTIAGYGMPKYALAAGAADPTPEVTQAVAMKAKKSKVGICQVTLGQYIQGDTVEPEVMVIQVLLNARGYKGKDGKTLTVDGVLGENTAYAVEQMQRKNGMVDINYGSVAGATWYLLLGTPIK